MRRAFVPELRIDPLTGQRAIVARAALAPARKLRADPAGREQLRVDPAEPVAREDDPCVAPGPLSVTDRPGPDAARRAGAPGPPLRHKPSSEPVVRTAPRGAEHFCWRIDILPRLEPLAGLELGAGVGLNIVAPARTAGELRKA